LRVIFSPEAITDLDMIVEYGMARWGDEAAERYSGGMRQRIKELAQYPARYPEAEKVRPGLRSFLHRRHRVFYSVDAGDLVVVRILHQQSDWQRLFP
jgi:toxin ParE1/3/4